MWFLIVRSTRTCCIIKFKLPSTFTGHKTVSF
jgi:hypothetical protein